MVYVNCSIYGEDNNDASDDDNDNRLRSRGKGSRLHSLNFDEYDLD